MSGGSIYLKRRDARTCNLIAGSHLAALQRVITDVGSASVLLSHQIERSIYKVSLNTGLRYGQRNECRYKHVQSDIPAPERDVTSVKIINKVQCFNTDERLIRVNFSYNGAAASHLTAASTCSSVFIPVTLTLIAQSALLEGVRVHL